MNAQDTDPIIPVKDILLLLSRNKLKGAPAVHPKIMLKVIFYSYAKGIYSSREMEDRMRWNPNYIYLSANQRVDHSTICDYHQPFDIPAQVDILSSDN